MSVSLSAIGHAIDPLCGPVGFFRLFPDGSYLSCGVDGWADEIAAGAYVTISLALATLPFGLALGFLIALAKQSSDRFVNLAANIYTTIFRGLPELLTLLIIYYGMQILFQTLLTRLGIDERIEINAFVAGMIALGVVFSSYSSEVLQSAFQAIPRGQYEAGEALGLGSTKTMLLVVLPQLFRIALPGLGNLWMSLLKDTALVSIIGLNDIIRQTGVATKVTKDPFFFYGVACLLFLALATVSLFVLRYAEIWAKKSEAR